MLYNITSDRVNKKGFILIKSVNKMTSKLHERQHFTNFKLVPFSEWAGNGTRAVYTHLHDVARHACINE